MRPVPIASVAARIEAAAPAGFDPSAIYDACRQGIAICVADGEAVCVLRCDGDALFVWWAHVERRGAGMVEERLPSVLECARRLNCQRLRFCSTLPMWLKRGPELGWVLVGTEPDGNMTFEMEVPPKEGPLP